MGATSDTGKFTIVIPLLNQFKEAANYLDSWFSLAKGRLDVLFIDNGSDELWDMFIPVLDWRRQGHNIQVLRNEENVGVYPTFQQGYELTTSPWIFYAHSDVEMLVPGWDQRLVMLLESAGFHNAGVCGMFGAKGLGTPDIYKAPYSFTQLMRWDCHTVESMAGAGGAPVTQDLTQCLVLDGFSLIINRDMIKDVMSGSFECDKYPPHHIYDIRICIQSHFGGYKNFVLDLDCVHHGGMTSTREDWAKAFNATDLEIHRKAHEVFYEEFRGKLPVSVQ